MKSIIAVLLTLGIGIALGVYYYIKYSRAKDIITRDSRYGIAIGFIFGFAFLAACVNGASVDVHTITSCEKSGHTTARYFLFYTAHFKNGEAKAFFLSPYGKDRIQNNTGTDLDYHSIVFGASKSYPKQLIKANTLIKASCEPRYYFEPVPTQILYSSRYRSSGKTQGLVLRHGDSIQHVEKNYWP